MRRSTALALLVGVLAIAAFFETAAALRLPGRSLLQWGGGWGGGWNGYNDPWRWSNNPNASPYNPWTGARQPIPPRVPSDPRWFTSDAAWSSGMNNGGPISGNVISIGFRR